MPGTVKDPSPRVSATGCEDGRRLSMGSGGRGHAPTQIISSDVDPSPRVSATGCEDSRRLNVGSGGRGHAPTQILISDDDPNFRAGDQRQRGHAPYQNADLKVVELQQMCPKPRAQVYDSGPMVPVVPDWLKVERRRKKTVEDYDCPELDLYKVVESINVYSRQKRGGVISSPVIPNSKYCILCSNRMSICLGSSCKGPGPVDKDPMKLQPSNSIVEKKSLLPGLSFVDIEFKPSSRTR